MAIKFSNNAKTTVSSAVSSTDTSISVADASNFPTLAAGDYTYATLAETSTPANFEIVKVTAISGSTLTIVRAEQSTTARSFSSGDACELRVTAGLVEEAIDEKAQITISETAPSNPTAGSLWFDPSTVETFIYYSDGNSSQWVQTNPTSGGVIGGGGSGQGVTVYATINDLPLVDVTEGAMALVDATDKLYIYSDTGWYSIAIVNTSPTISGVASSYTLSTDGSATVVTVTATDPEGFPLTYSIVSDTSGNTATVTQGTGSNTNQWTITPSTNSAHAGEFTLVFRASDGSNVASASSTFSLVFSFVNSNYTTALITSVGANNAVNNSFDDASSSNHSITVNGNVTQNTFSPYRHSGYSTYFDGSGDNLTIASAVLSTSGAFTVQCWVYLDDTSNAKIWAQGTSGNAARASLSIESGNWYAQIGSAVINTTSAVANVWKFLQFQYDGSQIELFIDGTSVGTASNTTNAQNTGLFIGKLWASGYDFQGNISDLRVISGAPSGSSTVPDQRLAAITNTSLLTCHLPYIADGSTNDHSITVNGNPRTEPWSPFDHSGYTAASHGGSMFFDGSGDYLSISNATDLQLGTTSAFTVEFWIYIPAGNSDYSVLVGKGYNTGSAEWYLELMADGAIDIFVSTNGTSYGVIATVTPTLSQKTWHHIAFVRESTSNVKVYTNGIQTYSSGSYTNWNVSTGPVQVGGYNDGSAALYSNCHISDLRFVKGTAVYTSAFTPPTAPLAAISYTSLLLRGTDAAIIDKSQSVKTITLNGDVKSSTTQTKYLSSSVYFDGTGDTLSLPDSPSLNFGSGDSTIEMWVYPLGTGTFNLMTRGSSGYSGFILSSTNFLESTNGSSWAVNITFSTAITANSWQHVAVVRNGSAITIYRDGTSVGTASISGSVSSAAQSLVIGARVGQSNFQGYMSDIRITKGLARYTSNFTAPTAALGG